MLRKGFKSKILVHHLISTEKKIKNQMINFPFLRHASYEKKVKSDLSCVHLKKSGKKSGNFFGFFLGYIYPFLLPKKIWIFFFWTKISIKNPNFSCSKNGKKYLEKYPEKNRKKYPKKYLDFFRIFLDGRSYYLHSE